MQLSASQRISYKTTGPQGPAGQRGEKGPLLVMVDWESGGVYLSGTQAGEEVYHVVFYKDGTDRKRAYLCIQSFTSASPSTTPPPQDPTHWEIATEFRFVAAELALIEKIHATDIEVDELTVSHLRTKDPNSMKSIEAQDNQLTMTDAQGNQRLRICGEDLPSTGTTPTSSTSISAATLLNGLNVTPPDPRDWSATATGTAQTFTVATAQNMVTTPQFTGAFEFSLDRFNAGTVIATAVLEVLIDGAPVVSGTNSFTLDRTDTSGQATVTVPANSTVLTAGSHTVAIRGTVELYGADTEAGFRVSYQLDHSATTLTVAYTDQTTEIAANGFRVRFGSSYMFEASKVSGAVVFTMRSGDYGLRVTSSGIQKLQNGQWVAASL